MGQGWWLEVGRVGGWRLGGSGLVARVGLGAVWQGGGVGQDWGLEVGQGRMGGQK